MSIVSISEVPGSIAGSPVSPTLVRPLASSSKRFGSPSNPVIGKSAAMVSVARTTNSWSLVPSFVMMNETLPSGA